jgi:hypothetical protein
MRAVLDFDPVPLLNRLNVPVLWIFGDPKLDRFCPVELSIARVKAAREAGKPYQLIQVENAGHPLEMEKGGRLQTILRVRIPLIRRLFRWLDESANQYAAQRNETMQSEIALDDSSSTAQEITSRQPSRLHKLLRELLQHFLLIGVALFGLYALLNRDKVDPTSTRINVIAADLERLKAAWVTQWKRAPSAAEFDDLVQDHICSSASRRFSVT